jgi:hypothetical protein
MAKLGKIIVASGFFFMECDLQILKIGTRCSNGYPHHWGPNE